MINLEVEMLKTAKRKISNNKKVISNLSYLTILQVFNMLLPLVTYPFLVRILGKEIYGMIIYIQSITLFITVFINFGFSISATRQISLYISDRGKLREIVNSVLVIKVMLFFIALVFILLTSFFVPVVRNNLSLFCLCMALPLYETIFPVWYFQGIEKMRFITILTLGSRILFTVLIFSFVRAKSDFLLVPAFSGVGALIAGITGLVIMYKSIGCSFFLPKYKILKHHFLDSLPLFISNFSSQINTRIAKILIGTFLSVSDVTLYDLAEKLVEALKTPIGLIGQAIYPKVVKERNKKFVMKVYFMTLVLYGLINIGIVIFASTIVHILGGSELMNAVPMVQVFSLVLLFAVCRHFLGVQLLLAWGYSKQYSIIITEVAIFYIVSLFILSRFMHLSVYHYIWMNIGNEILISLLLFIKVKRDGILARNSNTIQSLGTV